MQLSDQAIQKVHTLFQALAIDPELVELGVEDDTVNIKVNVPEEDAGIYIGRFASTLDSIQLILSLFLRSDELHHVHLDIGGYRQRRAETLQQIADRIAADVLESGLPRALPPLSATERRQVHLIYQDHAKLETYSEGEGRDRRLFLAPKSPKT